MSHRMSHLMMSRLRLLSTVLAVCVTDGVADAQAAATDTTPTIHIGAFVDGYYAYDLSRPTTFDRSFAGGALFTTQPARHNEFNLNLVFVEAKLDAARYRGRVALQAGTSVQSNYSGEPANGQVSGPSLGRVVQEAYAGVKIANNLWVDGGVFFSHMGMEGWVSRDNPSYTRSLVAEYSPYYSSGVKLTWTPSRKVTAQLHVVNGWQNLSENNTGKAVGVRLDFIPSSAATVSYYNFFSDEAGNRLRTFNGVAGKYVVGRISVLGEFDIGSQEASSTNGGTATWYGAAAIFRAQATRRVALVGRLERFADRDQIVMGTGTRQLDNGSQQSNPSFRGNGGSVGVDVAPAPRVLWRTELRAFMNPDAVFPDGKHALPRKSSGFVVSSLALTI